MADATVWVIVILLNGAHRMVLPQEFDDQQKCFTAAEQINSQDPRTNATCVPKGGGWAPPIRLQWRPTLRSCFRRPG
jgi:hypothetical protein